MLADQIFDLGLGRIVQRIVGGTHVGELGVAALVHHDASGQQRIPRRHRTVRTVRVPQPVAQVEHPPPVVARQRLLVLVQIGRVLHVERQAAFVQLGDVAAGRGLQRTEAACESPLLVVCQALIVEHQNRVAVHARLDRCHLVARQWLRDVHPGDFAGEHRRDLTDADGHGFILQNVILRRALPVPPSSWYRQPWCAARRAPWCRRSGVRDA
jgi:hypothetical protein